MPVDASVLIAKLRRGGVARSPLPDTALIAEGLARHAEDRLRPVARCPLAFEVRVCRVNRLGEAAAEIGTPSMIGMIRLAEPGAPMPEPDGCGLAASPGAPARSTGSGALDRAPESGALARAPASGAPALLALDSALAWHLTDVTLGGASDASPAVTVRSFTGIDLAMGRLFLEPLADALGEAIGGVLGRARLVAFALEEQRQTMTSLQLAPDHADVLRIRLDVAVGEARRAGRLDAVVPLATLDAIRATFARAGAARARERPDDLWRTAMRQAAAQAPVTLAAIIHRERMPLAAVSGLKAGDLIEIDPDAPGAVALSLAQPNGRVATIAHARLGAYGEHKVLRLAADPEPRLAAQIRAALALPPALPADTPLASLPAPSSD